MTFFSKSRLLYVISIAFVPNHKWNVSNHMKHSSYYRFSVEQQPQDQKVKVVMIPVVQ